MPPRDARVLPKADLSPTVPEANSSSSNADANTIQQEQMISRDAPVLLKADGSSCASEANGLPSSNAEAAVLPKADSSPGAPKEASGAVGRLQAREATPSSDSSSQQSPSSRDVPDEDEKVRARVCWHR